MPARSSLLASLLVVGALPAAAQDLQPFRAQEVRPVQAQDVQPVRAREVRPVQAQEVRPVRAQEVKPVQAQDVRPVQAQDVRPVPAVPEVRSTSTGHAAPGTVRAGAQGKPEALFGRWRTRLPGAVWQAPSPVPGYDVLHVTTGARAGDLLIRPDGTYVWQSYGGKSGRWERGDAEYPVVLVDAAEGKRWRVGLDPRRENGRELIIWDGGSFAYEGQR